MQSWQSGSRPFACHRRSQKAEHRHLLAMKAMANTMKHVTANDVFHMQPEEAMQLSV